MTSGRGLPLTLASNLALAPSLMSLLNGFCVNFGGSICSVTVIWAGHTASPAQNNIIIIRCVFAKVHKFFVYDVNFSSGSF